MQIESKIFFCDAKTNTRGLYLKISEKKANRERSTIIVPGRSLPWFRELFNYYATTDASYVSHWLLCIPAVVCHAANGMCSLTLRQCLLAGCIELAASVAVSRKPCKQISPEMCVISS